MAGVAEVDEPFAVEALGHFFEDGDAAGVVFDQVVVGGEGVGDSALRLEVMGTEWNSTNDVLIDDGHVRCRPCSPRLNVLLLGLQSIVENSRFHLVFGIDTVR